MAPTIIWSTARSAILLTAICTTIIHGFPIHRQSNHPPRSDSALQAYEISSDTYIATSYRNKRDTETNDNSSATTASDSAHHYRARRELNVDFLTAVDRMQKISRVINGIALQQSITKGTVQIDNLIMELLNFGSITPDDIGKIPLDTLDSVVKQVDGLKGSLEVSNEITRMENRMLLISSIAKTSGNIDKLEAPGPEYFSASDAWTNKTITWSNLDDVFTAFVPFAKGLEKITKDPSNANIRSFLGFLGSVIGILKNSNLKDIQTEVISAELRNPEVHFSKLLPFHGAVRMYMDNADIQNYKDLADLALLEKIGGQMTALNGAVNSVKSSFSDFDKLRNFLVSRSHVHGDRVLKQIPGLPSGSDDIDQIFVNFDDSWVQLAVDIKQIELAKSLDQLKTVSQLTNAIANSFEQTPSNGLPKIDEIRSSLMKLNTDIINLNSVGSQLKAIQLAVSTTSLPISRETFDLFYGKLLMVAGHLKAIDEVISATMSIQGKHAQNIVNLQTVDTTVAMDKMAGELDKLKKMEVFQDIVAAFKPLKPHFDRFNVTVSIDEEVKYIVNNYDDVIKTYIGDSSTFLTMLQNLQTIPELGLVVDAIAALRKYRGVTINDFGPIKKEIEDAKTKITDFKDQIGKMKDSGNPEAVVLGQESDVSKDSEVIGSATRVFTGIQSILEKQLTVVDPGAKKLIEDNLGQLDPVDQTNLQQLLQLDGQLAKLSTDLDAIQKDSKMAEITANLSSFHPVYSLASNVNGLQIDFGAMIGSVDKLAQLINNQQELQEVKSQLERLDSMGLDFANHQNAITGIQTSLDAMDLFFLSFAAKFTPITTPQPPTQNMPVIYVTPPLQSNDAKDKKNKNEKSSIMLYIIFGAIGVLCLISIIASFSGYKKYKDYKMLPHYKKVTLDIFRVYVMDTRLQPVLHAKESPPNYTTPMNFNNYYTNVLFEKYEKDHRITNASDSVIEMNDRQRMLKEDGTPGDKPPALEKNDRITVKNKKLFKVGYYHGNMTTCPNKTRIAMMQAPVIADNTLGIKENVGHFFYAAREQKSELIVCLVPFEKDGCDRYIPVNKGDTEKYMDGKLKIICTGVEIKCDGSLILRDLDVKFKGKSLYQTKHAQIIGWEYSKVPKVVDAQVAVLHMMENTKKPIFMHCIDGIGPSGAMVLAFMCKQRLVDDGGRLQYGEAMRVMRLSRANAITTRRFMFSAFKIGFRFIREDIDDKELASAEESLINEVLAIEELFLMIQDGLFDDGFDMNNNENIYIRPPKKLSTQAAVIADDAKNASNGQNGVPPPAPPAHARPSGGKAIRFEGCTNLKTEAPYHCESDEVIFNRLRKCRQEAESKLEGNKKMKARDMGDEPNETGKK